jgi:hypothetical protein
MKIQQKWYNARGQTRQTAGARQLGRRKARCIPVRFLTPPVENRTYGFHRIRLNTCDCSPWQHHEASVPISPVPRVSPRGQLTRALGPFVPLFSQARGLRLGYTSPCRRLSRPLTTTPHPPLLAGIGISSRVSPFLLSTSLNILRGASRVQHDRLKWNATGGMLSLPHPLSAAPQSLTLGYGRWPRAPWPPYGCPRSLLSPLVYDFRLNWLTSYTR